MTNEYPRAIDFEASKAPTGFTNINCLFDLTKVAWLHPVQSLYGSWAGKILILGQDYNGLNNLDGLKVSDLQHDAGFDTNKNLIKVFGRDADALYANFFWFIKDGDAQESFSTRKEVVDANKPIFESTINAMNNLSHIFPMGSITTNKAFNLAFNPLIQSRVRIGQRVFTVMPIPHLGNRGLGNFSRKHKLTKDDALERVKQAVTKSLKNLI
jgi:hypothetical protein